MSKLTLSQINEMPIAPTSLIELKYTDFILKIKTRLTEAEERIFVETIADGVFDGLNYSPTLQNCLVEIMFAKLFVLNDDNNGIEIPDETDDLYAIYDIIKHLDLVHKSLEDDSNSFDDYFCSLLSKVNAAIDFKKQKLCAFLSQSSPTTEAIENTNEMLLRVSKLITVMTNFTEKNSKKISKFITADKLQNMLNTFQDKGLEEIIKNISKTQSKTKSIQEDVAGE